MGYETGFFKRLFHKHYIDLFIKENYEMQEPQPLRFNNVMFCFICLAVGICLAVTLALMEITWKKLSKQKWATSIRRREEAVEGRSEKITVLLNLGGLAYFTLTLTPSLKVV